MADPLTVLSVYFTDPRFPRTPTVDFSKFIDVGPKLAPRGTILDTISLSADAQVFISANRAAFTERGQGMAELAKGTTTFGANDYSGAMFIGQNLRGATFNGSLLVGTNFTAANLRDSKFVNTLVTGARFAQADLRGADLSGAQDLNFDQIAHANFDATTTFPTGIGNAIFGTFSATGGAISSSRG